MMADERVISVVVPVYGVERYIEKSLRSIFAQTLTQGVEFIVVNDATPDRSMEIARRLAAEYSRLDVRMVEMGRNGGVSAARARGLAEARGEWIIFLDSDDHFEPTMLEEMWAAGIASGADVVVCDFWEERHRRSVHCSQSDATVGGLVGARSHGGMPNKLVRRRLYTEWGVSFTPGRTMWEDLPVCVELFMRADRVVHLARPLVHYVQRRSSAMHTIGPHHLDSIVAAVERIEELMTERGMTKKAHRDLDARKWLALHFLARNSRGRAQRDYLRLWPELGVWPRAIPVAAPFRLALWQARVGLRMGANAIYRTVNIKKHVDSFLNKLSLEPRWDGAYDNGDS